MRLSDAARVGLAVFVAAALLAVATFSLRGTYRAGTYTVKVAFPNALGVQEGAYVRVRGVDKGYVQSVDLGPRQEALLTLRLESDYRVRREDTIRIVAGLLSFTPPYVEITPAPAPGTPVAEGEVLAGEITPGTEQILARTDQLLENLTQLSGRMNRLAARVTEFVEDPALRRNLRVTTANFARLSESGVRIARNMESATAGADRLIAGFRSAAAGLDRTLEEANQLVRRFGGTADESRALMRDARALVGDTREVVRSAGEVARSTNDVVRNANDLVSDTRAVIAENRERVAALLDGLNTSLRTLDATLAEARGFLADPQLRGDLQATLGHIRATAANLQKITEDVRGITGDPAVQEDLRASIAGLREATEQAADVLERARTVLGTGGKAAKSVTQRLAETEVDAAVVHTTRSGRTRLDFDATIPWTDNLFYRFGFYDFGETNRFNAQLGQRLHPSAWGRIGFHASKLGLGLDVGRRQRPAFTVDFFGIDRPQADVRANLPVLPYLDLTLGVDDLFHRRDPLLGVRYRK